MKYLFLGILIVTSGFTCSSSTRRMDNIPGRIADDYRDLQSYPDDKNDVVCYTVLGYTGISCVKVK